MAFEHYDKCSLLLPMDGANNGTVFTDWSPNPMSITVTGDAKTVTDESKFYGSSAYFDGSGDFLTTALQMPNSGDWTLCYWARFPSLDSSAAVLGRYVLAEGRYQFAFRSGKIYHWSAPAEVYGSTTSPINTWIHVAWVSHLGTLKGYLNGVLDCSMATPTNYRQEVAYIGRYDNTAIEVYKGHLQDLMFVRAALWTANFTPPARLIGELSNANALAPVEDETGTPAERTIIAVPRSYPTRSFGAQSDSNGDFTLRAPATECSVIALHEGSPAKNDLIHRVTPV